MSIRDHKRQARLRLHQTMAVPALYIPVQGATPVPCTVRVHTKFGALGQLAGNSEGAQRLEAEPKIIFLASEVPAPRQNAVVSVEPGEAYRIQAADPADDLTITAKVVRVPAKDTLTLPIPVDQSSIPSAPANSITALDVANMTGHAIYTHMGDVQTLSRGNEVPLLNDRGQFDEGQKPSDITTFYDGDVLTGLTGDGVGGEFRISFTPADDTASMFALRLDIGGAIGSVFSIETPIQQGAAIEHRLRIPFLLYQRATWQANGARVFVMSDGPGTITRVQYVLHRLHKAR